MGDLITPDELPVWVPGELTVDSAPLGWEGVRIRGYRYAALDVPIPGMRDYMVVAYKDGATQMNRRCTGDWRNERVARGCVSLLTHAAQSHWRWGEDIEVTHVYLSPETMAQVAAEAYDRHIKEVELRDVLRPMILCSWGSPLLWRKSRGRPGSAAGFMGSAQEPRLRPHPPALCERGLPGAEPLRRALPRPMPAAQPIFGRKPGAEHIVGGACGRRAAQRVSLHAQIPRRIRLPAPYLRHAQAHRARQDPACPGEYSAESRRGQQRLLGPEPHDASVPTPARRHAGRIPQDDDRLTSSRPARQAFQQV